MNELNSAIQKADLYIAQIEVILDNYITMPFFSYRDAQMPGFDPNNLDDTRYNKQKESISDLKVKIKLFFHEQPTGSIYMDTVHAAENSTLNVLGKEHVLHAMKRALELFVKNNPRTS